MLSSSLVTFNIHTVPWFLVPEHEGETIWILGGRFMILPILVDSGFLFTTILNSIENTFPFFCLYTLF